jgi:molecular chaperone GrpE
MSENLNHENPDNKINANNEEQNLDQNSSNNQEKENLEQKITDLENKLSEANEKLLRTLADLDNTRRRSREDLEKSAKYAISNFVSDLVVVVENFSLANKNSPKEEAENNNNIKNFIVAIDMTEKELLKILEKYQVKRIFPLNEKFDHNFHEAIAQIESDQEEGTIIQVIQSGYTISDRLIRPALVGVAKTKSE